MGGRGTFSIGKNVSFTYKTVGFVEDAKILEGIDKQHHGLPEESHTSNKYIKLNPDGSFKELRIYDENHYAILDIDYHPEPNLLKNKKEKILHYHIYDINHNRSSAILLTKELYNEYKQYLKGINYD